MDKIWIAQAQLRSLGDCLERILLSGTPLPDDEGNDDRLPLSKCNALAEDLAKRTTFLQTERLGPAEMERWVDGCQEELAPLERRIDEAKGWSGKRLLPSEISEDEMTLRWLFTGIVRYFDGLEPEFSALPAHQLNRVLREVRLMQVWDVIHDDYQPKLRLALRHLESAISGAVCAPRN